MKVLAVSHLFPNAVYPNNGVFVKERLKNISFKADITIVAPVPHFPFASRIPRYRGLHRVPSVESYDGLNVRHPRYFLIPGFLKSMDGWLYRASMHRYFSEVIRTINPDILDFHWTYPDSYAGLRWARQFRKKLIVTVRGNEAIYYFDRSRVRKTVEHILSHADHVIAVSADLQRKLVSEYGVLPENVTVISNGIDASKFSYGEKLKARASCGLNPEGQYILSLCRLSSEKGLDHLLKAVHQMSNSKARLIVVGDGPEKNKLQALTDNLGIKDRVIFVGAIHHDKTAIWYNAADCYCLPSLWEGCPNTVIESVASGIPVVASRVGGIPDLIDERVGRLVEPGNHLQLAGALDDVLSTSWDSHGISEIGHRNSWGNVADRVLDVYRKVMG